MDGFCLALVNGQETFDERKGGAVWDADASQATCGECMQTQKKLSLLILCTNRSGLGKKHYAIHAG